MDAKTHKALMQDTASAVREQNLRDAEVLLIDIKNNPTPDLALIWADLSDAEIADEVDRIAHLHEWLNLS